jgi:AcrR family transcriptional regulator
MSPAASANASPRAAVRPLRQDAARNRQLLLDTARRVFGREGLDAGVETVAKEAGVGTGTLYRHFPSKDDLVSALIESLSDEVLAAAHAGLEHRDGSGLWEFMSATGALQAKNQGLLGRLWQEGRRPARVTAIRTAITGLVDDAHSHDTLPARVGQPDILLVLHGLRGVIESSWDEDPLAWRRYLEIATRGLKAPLR